MSQPAVQTATFLFTDIEGSTRLIQQLTEAYPGLLSEHRQLIAAAVHEEGGEVFGSEGDALFSVFPMADAALRAAARAQRALAGHRWPSGGAISVRMGLHTGQYTRLGDDGDYVGVALHEVARITGAGHGGMVLLSRATRDAVGGLPAGLELRDLGEHRLKDLAMPTRLYQLVIEGLAADFPALRTLDARPNNLPVQLTRFVDRPELAALRGGLAGTRLLTLTGPGGTGKTRLAVQLAAEQSEEFPDGVYFVGLETVRRRELIAPAVAAALGLPETAGRDPLEQVGEHLRDRRVLLVLDNLEQVDKAGSVIVGLLSRAPQLKVVTTSRVILRISGEQEFPVPPLDLPSAHDRGTPLEQAARSPAMRLLVERARAVQPDFVLDESNVAPLVDIIRRLDGLPLAIELAAARLRVLSAEALRARLETSLGTLAGGPRDLPARQQTLRGAIDWSFQLLDLPEQALFLRFGVFAGSAALAQAEEVCGPADELGLNIFDGLSSLSEKSLLRPDLAAGDEPRFSMLVTLRQYAREQLESTSQLEQLAEKHAAAYLDLVERCASKLTGADDRHWLDRLESDHDNLRLALGHLVARGDPSRALRFVTAAWRYWQRRGHLHEARDAVEGVTALPGVEDLPPLIRAQGFGAAGSIHYWSGDHRATHDYYGRALAAARETGDEEILAGALYNFGFAAVPHEPAGQSELYRAGLWAFDESLQIYRRRGLRKGIADASWAMSMSLAAAADYEGAAEHARQALDLYRELDDSFGVAWAAHLYGAYLFKLEQWDEAERVLAEATSIFEEARDPTGIVLVLIDHSVMALARGETERHARLGGAADRLLRETGVGLAETPVEFIGWTRSSRPDDPHLARLWDEGAAMTTDQAVQFVLRRHPTQPDIGDSPG